MQHGISNLNLLSKQIVESQDLSMIVFFIKFIYFQLPYCKETLRVGWKDATHASAIPLWSLKSVRLGSGWHVKFVSRTFNDFWATVPEFEEASVILCNIYTPSNRRDKKTAQGNTVTKKLFQIPGQVCAKAGCAVYMYRTSQTYFFCRYYVTRIYHQTLFLSYFACTGSRKVTDHGQLFYMILTIYGLCPSHVTWVSTITPLPLYYRRFQQSDANTDK